MNKEQAPIDSNSTHESPFEWLTNFPSLRHLVLPSHIVFGDDEPTSRRRSCHALLEAESGESSERAKAEEGHDHRSHQHLSCYLLPRRFYLRALHVGCGTSTLGESLACLREFFYRDNAANKKYVLQYGHVINVDYDQQALDSMKYRWERKLASKHHRINDDGMIIDTMFEVVNSKSRNEESVLVNNCMEWKHLDFASDGSCRMALDDVYRPLMQQTVYNAPIVRGDASCIDDDEERVYDDEKQPPGGCIDLVIDKSTLDCLLCSETDVIAQFLCEVYRALRVPSVNESNTSDDDDDLSWGGVYILITFHPVEFIEQLLKYLPGADWDVEYEVIQRQVEDVTGANNLQLDEVDTNFLCTEEKGSPDFGNDRLQLLSLHASCAWSSGTFHPDDNYRRTVNAFTCRRRPCPPRFRSPSSLPPSSDDNTPSSSSLLTYILDRDEVRGHIEQTCDNWYRIMNPIVTRAREERLRAAFLESAGASAIVEEASSGKEAILDLKQCYGIMFTDVEREHLDYEHFLEDWDAFCSSKHGRDDDVSNRGGMTVAIALDFLTEMQ